MSTKRNTYGQYCPVSRAVDVLGERWSLLILRDMLVGATRFNDLARGLPGLSRTLLSKRLRQLEDSGIVDHVGDEYLLTDAGRDLLPVVFGLGEWGAKWTFGDPQPDELDAELLVWWIHTGLDTSVLPEGRTVLHVRFTDDRRRFWVVIDDGSPSVCLADPGFDIDVTITSDLVTLYQFWLGRLAWREVTRDGRLSFTGERSMTALMPRLLKRSVMAGVVEAANG
jgi:DNA-binding HxlR family transcriptional regulator